jgi:hypothetical protein
LGHRTIPALPALSAAIAGSIFLAAERADAGPTSFPFNTGAPDARIVPLTRSAGDDKVELAIGDDFRIERQTPLRAATIPGLPDLRIGTGNEGPARDWGQISTDVVGPGVAPRADTSLDDSPAPEGDDAESHAVPLPGALVPGMATLLGLGIAGSRRGRPAH